MMNFAIWYKMAVEDTAMMLITGLNLHSSSERYNEGALHFRPVTTNYLIRNNNHGGEVSTFRQAARCFYCAFYHKKKMRKKNTLKYPYFTHYGLTIAVPSKEWCTPRLAINHLPLHRPTLTAPLLATPTSLLTSTTTSH